MAEKRRGRLRLVTRFADAGAYSHEEKHAGYCWLETEGDTLRISWEQKAGDDAAAFTMTLREGSAEMQRTGTAAGRLRFAPGRQTPGQYSTPFGELELTLYTHALAFVRDDAGGRLCLDYEMKDSGQRARMEMQWKC